MLFSLSTQHGYECSWEQYENVEYRRRMFTRKVHAMLLQQQQDNNALLLLPCIRSLGVALGLHVVAAVDALIDCCILTAECTKQACTLLMYVVVVVY